MYMEVCLWEYMHINAWAQRGQEEGIGFFAPGVTASYELLSSAGAGNWTLALHKNHTQAGQQSRPSGPHIISVQREKKAFNIQVLLIRNLLFIKKIFKVFVKFSLGMHQGQNAPVNTVIGTDWHEGGDTDKQTWQGPSPSTHLNGFNSEDCHRLTIVTHQ